MLCNTEIRGRTLVAIPSKTHAIELCGTAGMAATCVGPFHRQDCSSDYTYVHTVSLCASLGTLVVHGTWVLCRHLIAAQPKVSPTVNPHIMQGVHSLVKSPSVSNGWLERTSFLYSYPKIECVTSLGIAYRETRITKLWTASDATKMSRLRPKGKIHMFW